MHHKSTGAHHFCVEIGDEEASGLVDSMGAPLLRVCQEQNFLPVLEVGDDLEGLGHLASCEPAHDLAHCLVHGHHLWVQALGDEGGAVLPVMHYKL